MELSLSERNFHGNFTLVSKLMTKLQATSSLIILFHKNTGITETKRLHTWMTQLTLETSFLS